MAELKTRSEPGPGYEQDQLTIARQGGEAMLRLHCWRAVLELLVSRQVRSDPCHASLASVGGDWYCQC